MITVIVDHRSRQLFGASISPNTHMRHAAISHYVLLNVFLVALFAELLDYAPEHVVTKFE
jgi:hypothetical protein